MCRHSVQVSDSKEEIFKVNDQIDMEKAAAVAKGDLQKQACCTNQCKCSKVMMDKTPCGKRPVDPMEKVAEDLFNK